jgi:hypothetical protein
VQAAGLGAGRGGLAEQPGWPGEGAHVQPLELGAGAGPGPGLRWRAGLSLDDPGQEQREPAEQDVGADAVLEGVARARAARTPAVAEAAMVLSRALPSEPP